MFKGVYEKWLLNAVQIANTLLDSQNTVVYFGVCYVMNQYAMKKNVVAGVKE